MPDYFGDPYSEAKEVPLSEISKGYAEKSLEKITVRDSKVFAVTLSGVILRSYKERGGHGRGARMERSHEPNDRRGGGPRSRQSFYCHSPDLLFFILIIGGVIWLFRGIARSQSNAMAFGKSKRASPTCGR